MTLTVAPDRKSLRIQVSGNDLTLKPGEWSDWVHFAFPFNSLIKVQGIGKFKLLSLDPEIKLYLSPIDFDPTHLPPGFDVTTPPSFVHDLTGEHGLFKTRGWMIDTWSLQGGHDRRADLPRRREADGRQGQGDPRRRPRRRTTGTCSSSTSSSPTACST